MSIYKFIISAVQRGAIGIPGTYHETVEADDYDSARVKLYENYDHIRVIRVIRLEGVNDNG